MVVNDIESYPVFLPWCRDAKVYNSTATSLTATVYVAIGKIKQSFTTENRMQPGRKIHMKLVDGPFRLLQGTWQFSPKNDQTSRVSLDIEFEFKNKLLKIALGRTFNHIMDSMVESFSKRAQSLYGER